MFHTQYACCLYKSDAILHSVISSQGLLSALLPLQYLLEARFIYTIKMSPHPRNLTSKCLTFLMLFSPNEFV